MTRSGAIKRSLGLVGDTGGLSARSSLQKQLPVHRTSVAKLRSAAAKFAARRGATAPQCEDIALAVSEAVSNAVLHAYPRSEHGTVGMRARASSGVIEIVVTDTGIGMPASEPVEHEGYGLAIIRELADQLEIESGDPAGVRVRMTFSIG